MVSSFKDSMTNYKFGLMEYSIIIQKKVYRVLKKNYFTS